MNKYQLFLISALVFATFSLTAQVDSMNAKKDLIIGKWSVFSNQAAIEITEKDGIYQGQIIWLSKPNSKGGFPITDINNLEKVKRSQGVMKMICLYGFRYSETYGIWEKGYFYNPFTGDTIKATLRMKDNNTIEITGFAGFSLDFVKEKWSRF